MNKNTRKGSSNTRTKVSPGHLARIIRLDEEYTEWFNANRPVYPDPEVFDELTLPQVEELGFFDTADVVGLEVLGLRSRKKRRNKQKGGGSSGGQHGQGRKLPNPQTVLAEVQKAIAKMPVVGNTGNVVIGEWNMEFLDVTKAKYFRACYEELITRHHILLCCEVAATGLSELASYTGYKSYCSKENNRGQAVGFLVHPRLKVIGNPISYDDVGTVQGVPNLRPAYRLDLEDTVTGEKFSAVVVHLKSMRGGPKVTGPVRYQQCQKIAANLGTAYKGVIGGDWNTFLDNTTDTDPLTQAGFKLVNPTDSTSTQTMGGRLDGFFKLNITGLGRLAVRNFWKNTKIGRHLSDHGVLTLQRQVCKSGVGDDPSCGCVDSTGTGPYSDNPSDPAEVDTN